MATICCPGCGLEMPASTTAVYDGYYHASPECWSVYTEVLGAETTEASRLRLAFLARPL